VRTQLQALLAVALAQQNRLGESIEAARPACVDQEPALAQMRKELNVAGLCR